MSQSIGNRLPAPLSFDLGKPAVPGEAAHAVLLATVDEDGSPRIAVLSPEEVVAPDDAHVVLDVRADGVTASNLAARRKAALWCVLDGAAYAIRGSATMKGASQDGRGVFSVEIESVLCDFEASAPMIGGPTYRAPHR